MPHPELQKGEIFVGNHKGQTLPGYLQDLKTARLGQQAFDIWGIPLDPSEGYLPLFVSITESGAYSRIMVQRDKTKRHRGY